MAFTAVRSMALRATRTPARFFSSEIPINQVARVYRYENVGGEATAMKIDEIVKSADEKLKTVTGFVKTKRTVCKSEWAYEIEMIFDSYDSFVAYNGSDFREKTMLPLVAASTKVAGAEPYTGVRVYDEL